MQKDQVHPVRPQPNESNLPMATFRSHRETRELKDRTPSSRECVRGRADNVCPSPQEIFARTTHAAPAQASEWMCHSSRPFRGNDTDEMPRAREFVPVHK